MILIWGFRVRFKDLGDGGQFHCPHCHADRHYHRREARRWFTLFWIPLIPLKVLGVLVRCDTCGNSFRDDVLEVPTVAETADAVGFARRAIVAHMVDVSDNTTVARETAIAVMRGAGMSDYDAGQLDVDRQTSDWERVHGWVEHLGGTLSPAGAESMLMAAARVGAADGVLTEAERRVIDDLGALFGLTAVHLDGIVAHAHASSPHAHG